MWYRRVFSYLYLIRQVYQILLQSLEVARVISNHKGIDIESYCTSVYLDPKHVFNIVNDHLELEIVLNMTGRTNKIYFDFLDGLPDEMQDSEVVINTAWHVNLLANQYDLTTLASERIVTAWIKERFRC